MNCYDIYLNKIKARDNDHRMSTIEITPEIRDILDNINYNNLLEIYFDLKTYCMAYMANIIVGYIDHWLQKYQTETNKPVPIIVQDGSTIPADEFLRNILFQPHLLLAHILRRIRLGMILTGPIAFTEDGLTYIAWQAMQTTLDILTQTITINCFEESKIQPRRLKSIALLIYSDVLKVFDLKVNLLIFKLDVNLFARGWILDLKRLGLNAIASRINYTEPIKRPELPNTRRTLNFPDGRLLRTIISPAGSSKVDSDIKELCEITASTFTDTFRAKANFGADSKKYGEESPDKGRRQVETESSNWQSRYFEDVVDESEKAHAVRFKAIDNSSPKEEPLPVDPYELFNMPKNLRNLRYPHALQTIPTIEANKIYPETNDLTNRIAFELCDCLFDKQIPEVKCEKCYRLGVEADENDESNENRIELQKYNCEQQTIQRNHEFYEYADENMSDLKD